MPPRKVFGRELLTTTKIASETSDGNAQQGACGVFMLAGWGGRKP
jgi:hypothetical protein